MKTLALAVLLVLSFGTAAMAENEWYAFMEKYGIRLPVNIVEEQIIKGLMFRDPESMKGRRVILNGMLQDTERIAGDKRIYYLMVSNPGTNRWSKVAFLSMIDHRPEDFLMCAGVVVGSIRVKGLESGTITRIPSVKEVECLNSGK